MLGVLILADKGDPIVKIVLPESCMHLYCFRSVQSSMDFDPTKHL